MTTRILTTLCLLLYVSSYSQVEWGIKCGFNFSHVFRNGMQEVTLGVSPERGTSVGLHLGLLANIKVNEKFSFQPEIQISQKGYRIKQNRGGVHLNYLEVPLIASVNVVKRFNIEFGPAPSLLISESYFDAFDFGLIAGVKAEITNKLGIIARYNHGLKAIATVLVRDANNNYVGEFKEYNRCYYLGLTYKFGSK